MNGETPQAPDGGNWQYKPVQSSVYTPQPVAAQPQAPVLSPQPTFAAPTLQQPTVQPQQQQPIQLDQVPIVQMPVETAQPQQQPSVAEEEYIPQYQSQFASESIPESPTQQTWTASEFIAHEKTSLWYIYLAAAAAVIALGAYLLSRDLFSVVAILAAALILGMQAAHKPRVLTYHVNSNGMLIEDKFYPYSDFKSFGVLDEGAFSSIVFMPMKRFMPTLSVYYPPEQQDAIIEAISNYIPFQTVQLDIVDALVRRMHL